MKFQSRVESDSQGFELINKINNTRDSLKDSLSPQPPTIVFKLSLRKTEMKELWSRHSNDLNN